MSKRINLAIVGLGHVAEHQMAAIKEIPDLELIAVCDVSKRALDARAGYTHRYVNIFDMLRREKDLDAVVVSVPNRSHYRVALEAIDFGKHVLVEKPVTNTMEAFDTIAKRAKDRGVLFYTLFHAAHGKEVRHFMDTMYNKTINPGVPLNFEVDFSEPVIGRDGVPAPEAQGWQGSWTDGGINAISVMRQIIPDEMRIVRVDMSHMPSHKFGEVCAKVYFEYDNGKSGLITVDWTRVWSGRPNKNMRNVILEYEDQRIILDSLERKVYQGGLREHDLAFPIADFSQGPHTRLTEHYIGAFEDFVQHYRKRTDNQAFSRRCHEILFRAHQIEGQSRIRRGDEAPFG
ncbi:MAG: Gfo/Idh/MocA family oxidoreductase [archaeon]